MYFGQTALEFPMAPGLWLSEEKWVFKCISEISGEGAPNGFLSKMERQRCMNGFQRFFGAFLLKDLGNFGEMKGFLLQVRNERGTKGRT